MSEVLEHGPRPQPAGRQASLPGRYPVWVRWLAIAALGWAALGWLNEVWWHRFDTPLWLNRYTEYLIILAFGLWRLRAERNAYTRKRLAVLIGVVTLLWWLLPWGLRIAEPHLGQMPMTPLFPALHMPGTLSFFVVLLLVLLFGRRVICGWGCPCVGIRETVGFPFRHRTLRGGWMQRLRHVKWLWFAGYVATALLIVLPASEAGTRFIGLFFGVVGVTYFSSFFLMPLVGNRFYCRALCPFGATFGLLNRVGHYDLRLDTQRCTACGHCEAVCDMGIAVGTEGRAAGRVTSLEECMGCGRCVTGCPHDALSFVDVRNLLDPSLHMDGAHLLDRKRRKIPRRARLAEEGAGAS